MTFIGACPLLAACFGLAEEGIRCIDATARRACVFLRG
jgi:hypothetical protein